LKVLEVYKQSGVEGAKAYLPHTIAEYAREFFLSALEPEKYANYNGDLVKSDILTALGLGYYGYKVGSVTQTALPLGVKIPGLVPQSTIPIEGIKVPVSGGTPWDVLYMYRNQVDIFERLAFEVVDMDIDSRASAYLFPDNRRVIVDDSFKVYATPRVSSKQIISAVEAAMLVRWNRVLDQNRYESSRGALRGVARTTHELRKWLTEQGVVRLTKEGVNLQNGNTFKISPLKLRSCPPEDINDGKPPYNVYEPYVDTSSPINNPILSRAMMFVRVFGNDLK